MSRPNAANSAVQTVGGAGLARPTPDSLADVLERVLDKGVVIVGDIGISVLDIELLTLRIRLLVASVATAKEMGIDWWSDDPFYRSRERRVGGRAQRAVDDGRADEGEEQP